MTRSIFLMLLICWAASDTNGQKPRKKPQEGIFGKVHWIEGNQMPGPDQKFAPPTGVARDILIYEATRLDQTTQQATFFREIQTKLVAETKSHPDGTFRIALPPGTYSIFVREPNGLFANLFDKNNLINPVVVKSKSFTWVTIAVDYQAAY